MLLGESRRARAHARRGRGSQRPVPETRLALVAAVTALVLAPAAAAVGALVAGSRGAIGAGTGAGIVALLALASLPLYRWAGRRGPDAVMGAAFGGVVLRLTLAATAFALASGIPALSMTALALALAAALVATTAAEMVTVTRDPRLSFLPAPGDAAPSASTYPDPFASERPTA